ncbi:MAG: CRISPR-associated helicase Cas3', partial [Gammaproteobacteria bacterium]|nr:CRISPR-associated helicase Cas3' [Gammaproteobacteria bacterium]
TYWNCVATKIAPGVVDRAGLAPQPPRSWPQPLALFDYLREPTPLQQWAATAPLQPGPQLFMLEDVTGAGKTEAALILAQRLMQAGLARGLYFALPSMATANQMYQRVGEAYRRLFEAGSTPSLVLAHGARSLVDGFRASVLQSRGQPADRSYGGGEASASAQCNAWLASRQKLALLADVGVGTIDQVLLGILPVRHQSLRLVGLASKVLVVDEVHAYDPYMHRLLQTLLTAHAAQGGSVVLLSATMPVRMRDDLLRAFAAGRKTTFRSLAGDRRYPLAIHVGPDIQQASVDTRAALKRVVHVQFLHDEGSVLVRLLKEAGAGRCVCWIRNTVGDARRALAELEARGVGNRTLLFHSRFAMGDRLAIEDEVLARFGKRSGPGERHGWILIATQVVEQSLDLDFDLLISDLAPIDLLIQRAGRLRRHLRDAAGRILDQQPDGRAGPPMLIVHAPLWSDAPDPNWYSSHFPKAQFVYPDAYRLWLTQRALSQAGVIVTPGREDEAGAVRQLVEAVYDAQDDDAPSGLLRSQTKAIGVRSGQRAQADFNAVDWPGGFIRAETTHWDDRGMAPTRLGENSREFALVEIVDDRVKPICEAGAFAMDLSTVRVPAHRLAGSVPEDSGQVSALIAALPEVIDGRIDASSVIPMTRASNGEYSGSGMDAQGRRLSIRYSRRLGFDC